MLIHVETSTGVVNDLNALVHIIRHTAPDVIIAVDASISLGCIDVPVASLDLYAVFTGSQQGWMCPAGLMAIAINPRAIAVGEVIRLPCFDWHCTDSRSANLLSVQCQSIFGIN